MRANLGLGQRASGRLQSEDEGRPTFCSSGQTECCHYTYECPDTPDSLDMLGNMGIPSGTPVVAFCNTTWGRGCCEYHAGK